MRKHSAAIDTNISNPNELFILFTGMMVFCPFNDISKYSGCLNINDMCKNKG
jgi:hypothetical protein